MIVLYILLFFKGECQQLKAENIRICITLQKQFDRHKVSLYFPGGLLFRFLEFQLYRIKITNMIFRKKYFLLISTAFPGPCDRLHFVLSPVSGTPLYLWRALSEVNINVGVTAIWFSVPKLISMQFKCTLQEVVFSYMSFSWNKKTF